MTTLRGGGDCLESHPPLETPITRPLKTTKGEHETYLRWSRDLRTFIHNGTEQIHLQITIWRREKKDATRKSTNTFSLWTGETNTITGSTSLPVRLQSIYMVAGTNLVTNTHEPVVCCETYRTVHSKITVYIQQSPNYISTCVSVVLITNSKQWQSQNVNVY